MPAITLLTTFCCILEYIAVWCTGYVVLLLTQNSYLGHCTKVYFLCKTKNNEFSCKLFTNYLNGYATECWSYGENKIALLSTHAKRKIQLLFGTNLLDKKDVV